MATIKFMINNPSKFSNWQAICLYILRCDQNSPPKPAININDNTAFINYLKSNGIEFLVLDTLEEKQKTGLLPHDLIRQMQASRRISSVSELYNKQNILQTLDILNKNDIRCLILKGSALAYSLYRQPYQRIRGDTDLLIHPQDKPAVDALLIKNGYEKAITVSGKFISHQSTYIKSDKNNQHIYDLHWKLSNRNAFAELFDFDELYQRRETITDLGEGACRLSNCDALLHAIIHYYGHFPADRARLIWIYDIHLLCSHLEADQWEIFLSDCNRKKLDPLAAEALLLTQSTFKTLLPDHVLHELKQSSVTLNKIEQRRLHAKHWSRFEQFKSDWAALTLKQRCLLIKEYALPPGEFILAQNNSNNKLLLPYFYCKRLFLGGLNAIKNTRT